MKQSSKEGAVAASKDKARRVSSSKDIAAMFHRLVSPFAGEVDIGHGAAHPWAESRNLPGLHPHSDLHPKS